jgi:hypothetical protein
LITPAIAKLMARKGRKMIALCGATADVHDHITRNPGSFEATMRGLQYLKEAGAGFMVQLIPMKGNYHQFQEMLKLAESLSKYYRVGAAWLYLSTYADKERNAEIIRQRLRAEEVVKLDKPDLSYEEAIEDQFGQCGRGVDDPYLFSFCINKRREFHLDPYGMMNFCGFIKDPALRYDVRKGTFRDCWENFIPSLAGKIEVGEEYKKNCGSCDLRKDCQICPVFGYLEHGNFNKKAEYLCAVAKEKRRFKENWQKEHRRFYKIADITIQVDSDLSFSENTFHPKFKQFEVNGPGEDTIFIRQHFSLPDLKGKDLGKECYRKPPWAIYKKNGSWVYLGISPIAGDKSVHRVAVFNSDHTCCRIYNDQEEIFMKGGLQSLTFFPSDQILLARVLADRQGCYLHSCGVNFNGNGLLFVGHSEAGKSTMATMLKGNAEILCDDRIIVRKKKTGYRIYGTWSHGDVPDISANSAPLKAILFLEKASANRITPITDRKEINKRLLALLVKPFVTADWWGKMLELIDQMAGEVACYKLEFDKTGAVMDILRKL